MNGLVGYGPLLYMAGYLSFQSGNESIFTYTWDMIKFKCSWMTFTAQSVLELSRSTNIIMMLHNIQIVHSEEPLIKCATKT
jgi:hypothetical protein